MSHDIVIVPGRFPILGIRILNKVMRQIRPDFRLIGVMFCQGLAQRFCIPRRTVEDWCRGVRKATDYDRLMMAELLGLLKR